MRANRKDANQSAIEAALRRVGAGYADCTVAALGFDILIFFRGATYVCEIKNPDQPKSARCLTPLELKRKEQMESRGVRYHVVETVDEVLRLIGATR